MSMPMPLLRTVPVMDMVLGDHRVLTTQGAAAQLDALPSTFAAWRVS